MTPVLTVGITTRDRPEALRRALASLATISALAPEVLVFDDGSSVPAASSLAGEPLAAGVRFIRDADAPGYIAGRNRIAASASADLLLLMDDDAALLPNAAVERAIEVMRRDTQVAAIAFAQAEPDGRPWPERMQPARGARPRYAVSFIGFAHMVRADVFRALGGYRERFVFYGEEKDFCLRLLDAGRRIVYLPDARVVHAPDAGGRNRQRYLRYVARNDCLQALYNEPLHRLLWMLPARLVLYFRMRRSWGIADPGGFGWLLREVIASAPAVLRERHPVSRAARRLRAELRGDGPSTLYPCDAS